MVAQQDRRFLRANSGFSLVETLVLVAVFTLMVGAISGSVWFFYRTNAYTVEQSAAVSSAGSGVTNMVRDVREATYSEEGAYPIISMAENELVFYSDVGQDNSVERIRYFLDGDILKRELTRPAGDPPSYPGTPDETAEVAHDVLNISESVPVFTYFDTDGNEIVNVDNVTDLRFVRVNVIVNVDPQRLPEEFTLRSGALLRNLKDNY